MKLIQYWRSYDGIVSLSWICAIVFTLELRETSFPHYTASDRYYYGVMVVAAAFIAFAIYRLTKMRRRAEEKVKESDLILVTDIQTLVKTNSRLLDKALALHFAQMEPGSTPDD